MINPKVFLYAGQSWTDSLNIANSAGLNHSDVVRFIKDLELTRRFKSRCFRRERGIDADGHDVSLYRINGDGFIFLGEIFPHKDDPEEEDCIEFSRETIRLIKTYLKAFKEMNDKIFRGELRRIRQGKRRGSSGVAGHVLRPLHG